MSHNEIVSYRLVLMIIYINQINNKVIKLSKLSNLI